MKAPILWPHLNLIVSLKPHQLIPSHWGLQLQHIYLGGTQTFIQEQALQAQLSPKWDYMECWKTKWPFIYWKNLLSTTLIPKEILTMYDNHKLDLILAVRLGLIGFISQLPSQIYILLFSLEGVALSSPKGFPFLLYPLLFQAILFWVLFT